MRWMFIALITSTLLGCSPKAVWHEFVVYPVKRNAVSPERAANAIDDYFRAATDLVALFDDDECHAECIYYEFCFQCAPDKHRRATMRADRGCYAVVKNYRRARRRAFGILDAAWEGEVYGYVRHYAFDSGTRGEDVAKRFKKMDEEITARFQRLALDNPVNPVVGVIARDFGHYRGYDYGVSTFEEWQASAELIKPLEAFASDWRTVQLMLALNQCCAGREHCEKVVPDEATCADVQELPNGDFVLTNSQCPFVVAGGSREGSWVSWHCRRSERDALDRRRCVLGRQDERQAN